MGISKSKNKIIQLNDETLEYLLQNTKFTKQQIEAWYDGFIVSLIILMKSKFKE